MPKSIVDLESRKDDMAALKAMQSFPKALISSVCTYVDFTQVGEDKSSI